MKEIIIGIMTLASIVNADIDRRTIDLEVSAFCPCYLCSEGWGRSSASGTKLREGHIAAPSQLTFGTEIQFSGKKYKVVDRGGYIKKIDGVYRIDMFMETHEECLRYGRREVKGFIVKEGK